MVPLPRRSHFALLLPLAALLSCDDPSGPSADRKSPEISLSALAPGAVVTDDTLVVEGVASDDRLVSKVSYRLDQAAGQVLPTTPAAQVPFRFVLRDLALGEHQLDVVAVDGAGQETVERVTFKVSDRGLPVVTILGPAQGDSVHPDSVVVEGVAVDDRAVVRLTYLVGSQAEQQLAAEPARDSVPFRFAIPAPDAGPLEVVVRASDASGNVGSTTRSFAVRARPKPLNPSEFRLTTVASGLVRPTQLTAPAGDARLFVTEQEGRVRIVKDGVLLPTPFLDLTGRVSLEGGEHGLLGLAFHPDYARNGYFYVDYIDEQGDTRVERYRVSGDPDRADPASAKRILTVDQQYPLHHGGTILFGPDGMLYVSLGDGAGAGDYLGNAQNRGTLLGGLLRIDVDRGDPYAVPADNPWAGLAGARGELWAMGLRNPWRFWIDRVDGTLYVGDVGEDSWEEVNVVPASQRGPNFGWPAMEGSRCFQDRPCDPSQYTLPAIEYPHSEGCSVITGVVYRGAALPALRGHHVYGDLCGKWLRSFRWESGTVLDRLSWGIGVGGPITAIAEDGRGELYVLTLTGTVYRLEAR